MLIDLISSQYVTKTLHRRDWKPAADELPDVGVKHLIKTIFICRNAHRNSRIVSNLKKFIDSKTKKPNVGSG